MILSLLVGALLGIGFAWFSYVQGYTSVSYYQNASRLSLFMMTLVRFGVVFGILSGLLATRAFHQYALLIAFVVSNMFGTSYFNMFYRR